MMPSLASLMIIVMILDTGQSQDNCRDISDGCSCPRPNHLRCKIGEKHDFKGILEQIEENNITTFDVTLTNLTILEPEVFKNTQSLSALVISLSQLKSISKNAFKPLRRNLTALSLPNNLLEVIPEEIFELPNLTRLDLSTNHIQKLNIDNLTKTLKLLDLSDNDIIDINDVQIPVNLTRLVLKKNHLNMAAISQFEFVHLKKLDLSYNELNGTLSSDKFQKSNFLTSLDLSFNALVNLTDKCFSNFPSLRKLNLKSNHIELIEPMAFHGLKSLRRLDLSSNGILELPLNVFNGLENLDYLDLSSNHLQVISGTLTSGLFNLHTLKLGHNDIIRIEPLKDVNDHLAALSMDSNPLECSCQMRSFQAWVQFIQLSPSSKRSIRCSTPTKYANAILNNLDELSCDDEEPINEDYIIPLQLSIPEEFELLSKTISNDELNLKWEVKITNFTTDQVQLYRDDLGGQDTQIISKPLIPLQPRSDLEDNKITTVLEANFDLKNVGILAAPPSSNIHPGPLSAILACATIVKSDKTPVTNCTRVQLNEAATVVTKHAPLASLTSIQAETVIQGAIDVTFEVKNQSSDVECKINLFVEAGDADDHGERVVATHITKCEKSKFTFNSLRLASNDRLRVCGWLDFGPLYYHTHSVCETVISNITLPPLAPGRAEPATLRPRRPQTSAPLLPLVLTLVFLGVGIATLVVLYLIVKGYLSDRHKADLFRMRFCYSFGVSNQQPPPSHRPPDQGGVRGVDAKPPGMFMRLTHRFFMWKRRRHHRPVPASDELSLREESTFDTSVV